MGATIAHTCPSCATGASCTSSSVCVSAEPACCAPSRWQSYGDIAKQVAEGMDLEALAVVAREDSTWLDSPLHLAEKSPSSGCGGARAWRSREEELQDELQEQLMASTAELPGFLFARSIRPTWMPDKDAEVTVIEEDEVMRACLHEHTEIGGLSTTIETPRPVETVPQLRQSPEATPDFGKRSPLFIAGPGKQGADQALKSKERSALQPLDMNIILSAEQVRPLGGNMQPTSMQKPCL
mmetsp:Transcript_16324/g.37665  ORF Transcript_16324/g.37665 Transcript_16324/m.37665 type:complete len:239 (+) Transcript_16324:64-780(+)